MLTNDRFFERTLSPLSLTVYSTSLRRDAIRTNVFEARCRGQRVAQFRPNSAE